MVQWSSASFNVNQNIQNVCRRVEQLLKTQVCAPAICYWPSLRMLYVSSAWQSGKRPTSTTSMARPDHLCGMSE